MDEHHLTGSVIISLLELITRKVVRYDDVTAQHIVSVSYYVPIKALPGCIVCDGWSSTLAVNSHTQNLKTAGTACCIVRVTGSVVIPVKQFAFGE